MKNKQSRVLRKAVAPRPVPSSRKKAKRAHEQSPDDVVLLLQKIASTGTFHSLLALYDLHSQCQAVRQVCWEALLKRVRSPLEIVELCFRARGDETDKLLSLLGIVWGNERDWYDVALQIEPFATYRDTTRVLVAEVVLQRLPRKCWRALYESETDLTKKIHIGQFTGFAPLKLCTHRND